jgi:hypothetical protein
MKNVVGIAESLHMSYPDDPIWKKVYMASSGDISIFREYAPVHGHLPHPKTIQARRNRYFLKTLM